MSHKSFQITLPAAVAPAGTITVSYPTGTSRTTFLRGVQHAILALGAKYVSPASITVALGAASAVITYNGTATIPAGTTVTVMLDAGGEGWTENTLDAGVKPATLVCVDLGNPVVADADGISASQSVGAGAAALLNGITLGVLDVPRNVVGAWTTNSVITVTGLDVYGNVMVEAGSSAATFTGKKAFKSITSIVSSAAITGATFGTGDVLGLPVFVPGTASLLRESEDLGAPTAGTLVGGLSAGTKSTATTADVRGTYDPNSACDGTKAFSLVLALENPTHRGNPQFAG